MTVAVAVKICGITRAEDAAAAVDCGAEAVGFNFWPASARFCDYAVAGEIIAALPASICKIGVFVDESPRRVNAIAADLRLSAVQLHGSESARDCAACRLPVIKAIPVAGPVRAEELAGFEVAAFLFDSATRGRGGSGVAFDWGCVGNVAIATPVVLAGGLTPANVAAAISAVRPAAVDVASGVESSPGIKDHKAIAAFVAAARGVPWTAI
jgi:phosphoribosylanthranilate isomerase